MAVFIVSRFFFSRRIHGVPGQILRMGRVFRPAAIFFRLSRLRNIAFALFDLSERPFGRPFFRCERDECRLRRGRFFPVNPAGAFGVAAEAVHEESPERRGGMNGGADGSSNIQKHGAAGAAKLWRGNDERFSGGDPSFHKKYPKTAAPVSDTGAAVCVRPAWVRCYRVKVLNGGWRAPTVS